MNAMRSLSGLRVLLLCGLALLSAAGTAAATEPSAAAARAGHAPYADVLPGSGLEFPRDHGSHDAFRTEWWYVTGWLRTASGEELGFQVTFFRTRPDIDTRNPSAFTPRQLIIGHAALSDPARGRLWKAQQIDRAGFGLAEAATGDTRLRLGRWQPCGGRVRVPAPVAVHVACNPAFLEPADVA